MAIRWQAVAVTTDALGAGTATTALPVIGEIKEVRVNAVQYSATADYSVIRTGPEGGTVASIVNANGPFSIAPQIPVYKTGDGLASAGLYGTVTASPVSAGYLRLVIAQGGSVQAGTTYIGYIGD